LACLLIDAALERREFLTIRVDCREAAKVDLVIEVLTVDGLNKLCLHRKITGRLLRDGIFRASNLNSNAVAASQVIIIVVSDSVAGVEYTAVDVVQAILIIRDEFNDLVTQAAVQ
jgi:hypothetical protein